MPNYSLYRATLVRAANDLKSDELAARLHTLPGVVRDWLEGTMPIPVHVFLKVVDLLERRSREQRIGF